MIQEIKKPACFYKVLAKALRYRTYDMAYSLGACTNKQIQEVADYVESLSNEEKKGLYEDSFIKNKVSAYEEDLVVGFYKAIKYRKKSIDNEACRNQRQKENIAKQKAAEKARKVKELATYIDVFARLNLTQEQKILLKKMIGETK